METLIILLHVLTACAVVAFVLLQQGKGAEAGASFGAGASQTLFGSAGSWNFFSRVTAGLAFVFFLTSFGLAVMAKHNAGAGAALTPEIKILENAPAGSEVPAADAGGTGGAEIPVAPEGAASKAAPGEQQEGGGKDAAGSQEAPQKP